MNKLISALAVTLALAACNPEGPAERAGERIDDAADRVGDAARDLRDDAEDFADDVSDSIEDAQE